MKVSIHNSHLALCRNILWVLVILLLFVACANDDPMLENSLNRGHVTTDLGEADGFTSPEGTLLINNDNISTNQTSVQVTLKASDAVSVAHYYFSNISTTPLSNAAGWQNLDGSNSVSAQLTASISPVEETHSFYVWFLDKKGNLSDTGSDSIIYDVTSPASTSLSIDTGNIATNSQNVTLSLTASDAVGVTGHYSSESATTPDLSDSGWTSVSSATAYSGTANFTMSSGEGTKTVYAWFRDFAGNISVANNDTIILDQSAPTGSVSINSGASSTSSKSVTLTLAATDGIGVTGYYVSNSSSTPSSSDSGWTTVSSTTNYSASASFTLAGICGTNSVYVWFRDAAGNVSSQNSDLITLGTDCDRSSPSGSISIKHVSVYDWTSSTIIFSLSATDNVGVTGYYVSTSSSSTPSASASGWTAVSSTTSYSKNSEEMNITNLPGWRYVYAWFKDAAGNVSSRSSDSMYCPSSGSSCFQ